MISACLLPTHHDTEITEYVSDHSDNAFCKMVICNLQNAHQHFEFPAPRANAICSVSMQNRIAIAQSINYLIFQY